jgi:hypothetical protein
MNGFSDSERGNESARESHKRVSRRPSLRTHLLLSATAVLWITGIAYGLNSIRHYESTPGAVGLTPTSWPSDSQLRPDPDRASLVMLVHPQCSCTRASLEELNTMMSKMSGRISAWVLFIRPAGMEQGWERTATWSQAQRIPGVTVVLDPQGAEATRFGALTSGEVALYDPAGHLLFSGGITGARGHVGDNLGRRSVLGLLDGDRAAEHDHPVYGCPL